MEKVNFTISEKTNELLNIIKETQTAMDKYLVYCGDYWDEGTEYHTKASDLCYYVSTQMLEELSREIYDALGSNQHEI